MEFEPVRTVVLLSVPPVYPQQSPDSPPWKAMVVWARLEIAHRLNMPAQRVKVNSLKKCEEERDMACIYGRAKLRWAY